MTDGSVEKYIDNELVSRTRSGDVSAFKELFKRHHKRVYNIAVQMLTNDSEAADATQEIFVRVYQCIGGLKSDAAFVTWLKTMSVNLCRDILRKRKNIKVESLDAPICNGDGDTFDREIVDWSDNPERLLHQKEMKQAVQKAISSLSPVYREVVALFYVDQTEVAEIARILGCPVGTIKCRLARARAELKRKLAHHIEA